MEKKVLRNLSYGMYVVGAKKDRAVGCIANTVVQITSDPATIAVSINHDNHTNGIIKETGKFSISILTEETESNIIATFGYQTSKDVDKYAQIETEELAGLPVLKNSCGNIVCKVIDSLETKTHTIFLGEILEMENYQEKVPMTYRYYQEERKGKSPKNAPTYNEETEAKGKTVWKCSVCGYEVEMDELPEDYRCPICGQPVTVFKKIEK